MSKSVLAACVLGILPPAPAVTLRELLAGPPPQVRVYKQVGNVALRLWIFRPEEAPPATPHPAIVWIHGGAWVGGSPESFLPHARYVAARGAVGIVVEYRLAAADGPGIGECLADCKSAFRHLRAHAGALGIDPARLAAAGDSAGGHLAAALATLDGWDDPQDDPAISARPDALLLFNPVLDLTEDDWVRYVVGGPALRDRRSARPTDPAAWAAARALSPLFHVHGSAPPLLLLHGRDDAIVPWTQARRLADAWQRAGGRCELHLLEATGHAFVVPYYKSSEAVVVEVLRTADRFLAALGWLQGAPRLEPSSPPVWEPRPR